MEDMVVGWGMVEEEKGKGGKTRFDKVLEGLEESESGVVGSSGAQRRHGIDVPGYLVCHP